MSILPSEITSDIITSKNPKESEDEVLERLQKFAMQAIDHAVWRDFREKASKDFLYWEGDQWSADELQELANRNQPATVFNEIKPIIERMKGQIDELYQTVRFIGRNAPDESEANTLSEILRWIDQQNEQEFEEGDATMDMLVCGMGVEEITVEEGEDGEQTVVERYIDSLNHIYPDPYSRKYDWNDDARFIIRAPWMDNEDAIAQFPDKRRELEGALLRNDILDFAGQDIGVMNEALNQFVDRERNRVRLVETWYKRKAVRYQILDEDGKSIPVSVPLDRRDATAIIANIEGFSIRKTLVNEMWVGTWAANILIHHDRSPHEHGLFPFVPIWGWRKKNGGPYGVVRNLVSINEAINKRESKSLHLLSNNQMLYESGALDDPVETATKLAQPDGMVEVTEGALTGNRVILRENRDMGQAQLNMHQNAVGAIQRVATATDRDRGLSPEIRSGVGVARQQRGSNLALSPLMKNIRRSRRMKAKLKLAYVKQYFTEDLVFQITDDPNGTKVVEVGASTLENIRNRKYDVVIIDDVDYNTTRAEEQAKLANTLAQTIQYGPAWTKVMVSLSNLREKEGIMKMIDQISQAPAPAPKMALSFDYEKLDPEERAAFWIMMENPQMAQHIIKNRPDSALMKQIKAEIAKVEIKEGTKAMMERGKNDERAAQIAADGIQRARELDQKALVAAAEGEQAAADSAQQARQGANNA